MISSILNGTPQGMRRLHGLLTVVWLIMIPISFVTGLADSVLYVVLLSEIALVLGSWGAYQAARGADDVVEAIVADDRIPTEGAP